MDSFEQLDGEIQHLLIRYLEGNVKEEEIRTLQDWMAQSEKNFSLFSQFKESWLQAGSEQRYRTTQAWQKVESRIGGRYRRLWLRIAGSAAAVMLLGIGAYYLLSDRTNLKQAPLVAERIEPGSKKAVLVLGSNEKVELGSNAADSLLQLDVAAKQEGNTLVYAHRLPAKTEEYNRLITPRGGEYSVILADGTKVWLNAESELRYPVAFSAHERKVYLKGEAYFSVTKQEDQPFVVCVGETRVTVLGTEFNVRSYQDEALAATLVKGKVRINNGGHHCCLLPGRQAVVKPDGILVREVETILYTAWKEGYFIYREKTLEDILKELSRWYDFTYRYQKRELGEMKLTAKLRKFDRVEDIFNILRGTGRLDFAIQGKNVTVLAK